jgi:hypothetical protein
MFSRRWPLQKLRYRSPNSRARYARRQVQSSAYEPTRRSVLRHSRSRFRSVPAIAQTIRTGPHSFSGPTTHHDVRKVNARVAHSVRESVHLSVLRNGCIVVLLDMGSPLRVRFAHEIGAQFPPILTNSGRLLLAYLPPELLEEHLDNDPDYAEFSPPQKEAFHEELKNP